MIEYKEQSSNNGRLEVRGLNPNVRKQIHNQISNPGRLKSIGHGGFLGSRIQWKLTILFRHIQTKEVQGKGTKSFFLSS